MSTYRIPLATQETTDRLFSNSDALRYYFIGLLSFMNLTYKIEDAAEFIIFAIKSRPENTNINICTNTTVVKWTVNKSVEITIGDETILLTEKSVWFIGDNGKRRKAPIGKN